MRAVLLFFLAVCVVSTLANRSAVDLWFRDNVAGYNPGMISFPPIQLGASGAIALEANCYLARAVDGERNSLFFFGARATSASATPTRSTADDIEVSLVNSGSQSRVAVKVGVQEFTSTRAFNAAATWAYIAVNIFNRNGVGVVEIYINGLPSGVFTAAVYKLNDFTRDYSFMGYAPGRPAAAARFRGMVDTVQIWNQALDVATIQAHAGYTNGEFPWSPAGLIVRFDFTETVGRNTRGRVGLATSSTYVATVDQPRAVFSGGDFIGWFLCSGWGDPHFTTVDWAQGATAQNKFDTTHVKGFFNLVNCKNSQGAKALQMSSYHQANSEGGYTVNRAMSVRHGNSMFQYASSFAQTQVGLDGPFLYKEIPVGADPATVPWIPMVAGETRTLESGMVVTIQANGYIDLFAAPFLVLSINNYGSYCDFTSYINAAACYEPEVATSVCRGARDPVAPWYFIGTPNPVAVTPAAPAIEPPPQVCEPQLLEVAERNCHRCFPDGGVDLSNCVIDICHTGNPWCPPPKCKPGVPCCNCAPSGQCVIAADNSTSCACSPGYGGADCSQPLRLVALEATPARASQMYDNRPYTLAPHSLNGYTSPAEIPVAAEIARANPWVVKNSLLVYVATTSYPTPAGLVRSQHLYIINDATSFPGTWAHTLTLGYTGFENYNGPQTGATRIGSGVSFTGALPSSAAFSTNPTSSNGIVIPNLPTDRRWCVSFTTSFTDAVGQAVVGSGNIRGQLELLRVVGPNSGSFQVCGEDIPDPCPELRTCRDCVLNNACGWCRTSGQCHFGRPAGPTDGSVCPAWAFSFQPVTRRITQTYGYPVSPIDTTVVLGEAASLSMPVEIKVDMAYRYYSAWDIQILFPTGSSNAADLTGLKDSIRDISDRLAARYLNSALSVATYARRVSAAGDGNGDLLAFNQIFPLSATTGSASIYEALASVSTSNGAAGTPLLSSVAIPRYAGLANNRRNARSLMIIFATEAAEAAADVTALRNKFLTTSTMPIFVVSRGARAYFNQLVSDLGFGLVLDYAGPTAIGLSIDRALTDATGATFVAVDSVQSGRIDTATLNSHAISLTVTGMSSTMVSRNNFPVSADVAAPNNNNKAVVLAPGFGKATIDTVPSDDPITTPKEVYMVVGQPLDPYTAFVEPSAALAYASGSPALVLQSNALVTAGIWAVSRGRLYQFDEAALRAGAQIDALTEIIPDGVNYQTVTDVQGRVVYVPPTNAFEPEEVFATITYRVSDECSDSPNGVIPIYVAYANNKPPTTLAAAINTQENKPVAFELSATDYRAHSLQFVFPTDYIVNSAAENPNQAIAGKVYVFSEACLAAVNADIVTVPAAATCTPVVAGTPISGSSRAGPEDTTISTARFIYVPYQYANSEGIPAVYLTKPVISYTAKQVRNEFDTDNFVSLITNVASFGVNVSAVNQAPFAHKPTEATGVLPWLSFDASAYTVPDAVVCQAAEDAATTAVTCTWDQNMGVPYPGIPSPVSLFTVGFDVDSDPLSVVVKSVTCPSDAILNNVVDGSRVTAGQTVNAGHQSNRFAPTVTFRPSLDGSGDPYCSFTYVFSDGQLESEVRTMTVKINSVPLPPRSSDQRFFAPTVGVPLPFTFTAGAVSIRSTQGVIPHYVTRAEIIGCSGDAASTLIIFPNTVALDCATVSEASPYVVTADPADATTESLYGFGTMHVFAGNWTPTAASVVGLELDVKYTDDQSLVSSTYSLSFSYRQVNAPPELKYRPAGAAGDWLQEQTQSVGLTLSGGKTSASLGFNARDDSGLGIVELRATHSGDREKVKLTARDEAGWLQTLPNGFVARAPIAAIDEILATLGVNIADAGRKIDFTVTITLNDNTFTGACSQIEVTPCAKEATAIVNVAAAAAAPATAIGLSAAAGAAALAAAGAAAIAWRALREPPTESYNPWEMDDNNEGTVMNPLFEGTGNSGGNPMFEGAAKP